ncbi:MAG: UDP-N-acetylmuramate dehydrogenase [Candidatus Saccharibacteria bacterium]
MTILEQVPLADYSTMRLGGSAAYLCEISQRMELLEALDWARQRSLPVIMIGSGSNIIWRDEGFSGLLIVNKILKFELFQEDDLNTYLTIGSGEPWDSVVQRSVAAGLTGIEALSLIPGTAGATPIQNVGAYGQDISQTLVTVEAFDTVLKDFVTLAGSDCGFGYRTSRFKTHDLGRYFITGLALHLNSSNPLPPFYPAVTEYLAAQAITAPTAANIRAAVVAIRTQKLPDPGVVANSGSFFANPIIGGGQLAQLQADSGGEIPHWSNEDGSVKLAAAWLIEQAGFKDYHDPETGMGTWPAQPLVVVNERATHTANLLAFKQKIVSGVQTKFGITLEQEPELLPLSPTPTT